MLRLEAFLSKGPDHMLAMARWYAQRFIRRVTDRQASIVEGPSAFLSRVDLTMPGLETVRRLAADGDTTRALSHLAGYFRTRTQPAFFFNSKTKPGIVALIDEDERQATIAAADEICQHTFRFRGEPPVTFEGVVDWTYQPHRNQDWTWDLNRHTYFITLGRAYAYTGDGRYAHQCRSLLLDWLAHNPPRVDHPNWRSPLEVAIRISTWTWALYYFRDAPEFEDEALLACLSGIEAHGRYLAASLEHHVPNNHLLLEAKALALAGILFPEFRAAKRWHEVGLRTLWTEVLRQVYSDGVHGELATCYHRIIICELLEMLVLLENNNQPIPPEVLGRFSCMLDYEASITKPDGSIPLLGDSSLDDVLIRYAPLSGGAVFLGRDDLAGTVLDEPTLWLVGPKRAERLSKQSNAKFPESRLFPKGGYAVMRHGWGEETMYLVFDCGPFGYPPAPGHGHADALSIELYANGCTLLLDPGVYGYFLGASWRNFFRSTRAHNTVVVDDQDQSRLLDTWRVYQPARTTLHRWITSHTLDFADASHDGYIRLCDPITHQRQILFVKGSYWVIVDRLEGSGRHHLDLLFHLPVGASATVDPASGAVDAMIRDESGLIIAPVVQSRLPVEIVCGGTEPIQGWVSLCSGYKEPAPVVCFTQNAQAPAVFCTVLYPYLPDVPPSVSVTPLAVDGSQAVGVHIMAGDYEDWVMIRPGGEPTITTFEEFQTDARIAFVRRSRSHNVLTRVTLGDGRRLSVGGQLLIDKSQIREVVEWDVTTDSLTLPKVIEQ